MLYRGKTKTTFQFLTLAAIVFILLVLPVLGGCASMTSQEKKDMAFVIGVGVAAAAISSSLNDGNDGKCIDRDPAYPRCDP